jgi:hypothetical protein
LTDVGLRGHGRDGVPEPGWAGRLEDRNVAFVRLLTSSGLRRAEGGSLLTFEVPEVQLDGGRYYRGKVAAGVTRSKKDRTFYVAADAAGATKAYADSSHTWGLPFGVRSWDGVFTAEKTWTGTFQPARSASAWAPSTRKTGRGPRNSPGARSSGDGVR